MSKDAIFIMNVEQYSLCSRRKGLLKTRLYCLFNIYITVVEENKVEIYRKLKITVKADLNNAQISQRI